MTFHHYSDIDTGQGQLCNDGEKDLINNLFPAKYEAANLSYLYSCAIIVKYEYRRFTYLLSYLFIYNQNENWIF